MMQYVRIFIVLCLIAIFSAADALSAAGQGGACGFLPTGDFICGEGAAAPKVPSGESAAKALRKGISPGASGGTASGGTASGGSASGTLSGTPSATGGGTSSAASSLTGTGPSTSAQRAAQAQAKAQALLEKAKSALAAQIAALAAAGAVGTTSTGQSTYACGNQNLTRKWTPPALSNPRKITASNGQTTINLGPNEDVIVTCDGLRTNRLFISGGRNVVVRDCKIKLACAPYWTWETSSGIALKSFTGSFLAFENVNVDVSGCVADGLVTNGDGVARSSPYDVYVFNSVLSAGNGYTENYAASGGKQMGYHADVFQDQSASSEKMRNFYVENVLAGSWQSGFTSYNADNIYVRNTSVVPNDALGKTCPTVYPRIDRSTAYPANCSKMKSIHPSYTGHNMYADENVNAYGCAPCSGMKLVSGSITQTPTPKNFTCLPANVQ